MKKGILNKYICGTYNVAFSKRMFGQINCFGIIQGHTSQVPSGGKMHGALALAPDSLCAEWEDFSHTLAELRGTVDLELSTDQQWNGFPK